MLTDENLDGHWSRSALWEKQKYRMSKAKTLEMHEGYMERRRPVYQQDFPTGQGDSFLHKWKPFGIPKQNEVTEAVKAEWKCELHHHRQWTPSARS